MKVQNEALKAYLSGATWDLTWKRIHHFFLLLDQPFFIIKMVIVFFRRDMDGVFKIVVVIIYFFVSKYSKIIIFIFLKFILALGY